MESIENPEVATYLVPDELLTLEDVMHILKVGKNTVYLLQNSKLLPYLKLGDRKVRRRTVEEFMARWDGVEEDILALARAKVNNLQNSVSSEGSD